ncbi:membrane metalloprotease [Hyunsoonleella aestuarii]|uniref:Membrane metalloprotease n=1 Tax=Hyunsoonleella aestuarii TaxID=912802 RepID=A0ABP8EEN8_9FLAO|nr:membrane metalloprotease [Hyunsoonleella aestuarii]
MKKLTLFFVILLTFFYSCSKDDTSNSENTVNVFDNRQATGSSANDILSDAIFKSIIVELVFVEGLEPTQTAIDNFVSFLQARTFKPQGITVEKRSISSMGKAVYSIEEIADVEREERINYNTDDEIAIWAYFTDGKSENDTDTEAVLGTAYWNTSFVIYQETVENLSNSPQEPNRSLLETTVITHEFGHILGLTNLGTPMQTNHEDPENEKHCDVESCLMFWTSETGSAINNMGSMNSAPQLDSQCITDLQANGGR